MEYVHGEDLKSMIEMSGSLSVGMLLSVGKQVCEGLAEAHGLGVVHRDLKPPNIMIDKHGNARIMDFGIARSIRERGITGGNVMIGTPEYMSPSRPRARRPTTQRHLFPGRHPLRDADRPPPVRGRNGPERRHEAKERGAAQSQTLNPQIPEDLSRIILKCLEKDKAKRYQSAADVHSDLERIEKGCRRRSPSFPSENR